MASCKSIAGQTAKFWNEHQAVLQIVSAADPKAAVAYKLAQTADKMIRKWNSFFGKGKLKIGPRKLDFGKTEKGTVTGPTQRMWLTKRPTLGAATVRLKKLDGRMKTRITICTFDKHNKHRQVKSFYADRKDKDGSVWTARIPAGRLVSVLIGGRVGTNRFKYEVGIKESKPAVRPRAKRR